MKLILDERNLRYIKEDNEDEGFTIDENGNCVVYGNGVRINHKEGNGTYDNEFLWIGYKVKSVRFVKNATQVERWSFAECHNLIKINSSLSVTKIGESAFESCDNLTTVIIPNVVSIGESAFGYCHNLTIVNIPKCKNVGDYAFYNCESLTTMRLPECENIGDYTFFSCEDLTTVVIPKCENIGEESFLGCNKLKTIIVGNEYIAEQLREEYPNVDIIVK